MVNKLFKSIFAAVLVIGSALGFVACENEGDDVVADPSVEVSATSLNFTNEEGNETLDVTANADWKAETDADWVTITPAAGKGDATITIAVSANDTGAVRTTVVKVIALHKTYGAWDTKKVTVSQSATETPTVKEELLYGDNFDGEEATKTYGSGSSWPYIDQFPQFANQEGPASENVTYSGKGVSVRANSTSNSQYSDYEGSGLNNIFFGSSAYFQVNNITLAEGQQNLKLTFGSEKYTQDGDSTFKNEEFRIYVSKDGNAWAEIKEYTFAGTEGGRWNMATAEFTLNAVPETLYLKFAATVASVYRLDDVKLYTGNGGQAIDLDNIEAPQPSEAKKVTVAEFLAAAEDSTIYELTGEITNVTNTTYGNFYLNDGTGEVLIYGLCSPSGEQKYWAESGAKVGDTITVQTVRTSYNGTPQGKDAIFVSLVPGEGGGDEPTPEPAEGPYASDVAFVCSTDDSTNAVYSLGATTINGNAVTGFKLGKGKQTGLFKSAAVGVSGDKYLNLYAVAWKGGDAKLYFRVDGGTTQTLEIAPNDGASNNAPYTALTFAETDHYSVKLSGLTASSTIEFSTDPNFELTSADEAISYARAIVCGVKLTDEPIEGEGGGNTPAPEPGVVKATVAEFLAAAEDSTIYELTGEITNVTNTTYGNFYLKDATGEVLIYGLCSPSGEQKYWAESGAKVGDTITVQTVRTSYNGTPQGKDAIFVSLVPGEGGGDEPTPEPAEGPYASDVAFVCSTDDSTNAVYSLGATTINGNAVTGFKLGKGKQTGLFKSAAVGVSGDKYLNLYAVAWKGGDAKLYFRVDGGTTQTLEIAPNDGASNNAPYTALTFAETDHYSVKLSGLTASSTIEFSTDPNFELTSADEAISYARAIVCGVKLTDEPIEGEGGGNTPAPEPGVVKATVAEFLAAAEDSTIYELTGVITRMYRENNENDTLYGNFYLEDATGEVLIYGLMDKDGNKYWSASGVKIGDTITVQTIRTSYNGTPQGKNATYISHTAGGGETPEPEPEPTPGDTMTIADVLAKGEGATIGGVIEGVVISNMDLNNLTSKKGLYVQDETGALQFYLAANHEFAFGTKVKIDLTTATLGSYNGAVQVSGVALDKITVVSTGNTVEAKTVSMADFLANKYEGQYIAIEGVQVAASDLSKTWVMDGAHTSIAMEDANGNSFVVFSSKYASYGTETVAQGAGTIKGISSISKGAIQIIFAQSSDYAGLSGERFGDAGGEEPDQPGDEPVTPEGWAGRDDFNTLDWNSSYSARQSTAGWVGENCAVQAGGANDANPVFNSLLGADTNARAWVINGKTSAVGKITSPVITTGCGTLQFTYGMAFTEKNGYDFTVYIMQNGEVVKSFDVVNADNTKYAKYTFSEEVNVAGDFQIVITNNCPSANADSNKDRYSIWDIMWTAHN